MYDPIPEDASLAGSLPDSPLELLGDWLSEAWDRRLERDPWAMCVSTADEGSRPSSRMLICRGYDRERGYVVFHTNRESRKGRELSANPHAAAVFHWGEQARQVRLEGPVDLLPDAESDAYFASRQRGAQVSAWTSAQSEGMRDRAELLAKLEENERRFADVESIPRPPHWGGYRLWIEHVELWIGATSRVHDRAAWTRTLSPGKEGFDGGAWKTERLQP